jgi:TetR/AcrR family transcriptional repressor of nem operon
VTEAHLTPRGAATRARIVQAAADLMYVKGINATTLDDVRAASNTSKSQLYQHFPDKDTLTQAVLALQAQRVLEREMLALARVSSLSGLRRWRNALVQVNSLQAGAFGCALGSMANEIADQNPPARAALADVFGAWEKLIADGLRRMQGKGKLSNEADPERLAIGVMAALQGGYLLAQTAHDVRPMAIALDMALDHLQTFAT